MEYIIIAARSTARRQCGQDAQRSPAMEVFFQDQASENHCDGRVERADDDRAVEASHLFGADEQGRAGGVDASGEEAQQQIVALEIGV